MLVCDNGPKGPRVEHRLCGLVLNLHRFATRVYKGEGSEYREEGPAQRSSIAPVGRDGARPKQSPNDENTRSAANGGVPTSDRHFMDKAAQGGMAEVELGHLAQQNAQSSDVKSFAKRMVDDHGKASDQLKQHTCRNTKAVLVRTAFCCSANGCLCLCSIGYKHAVPRPVLTRNFDERNRHLLRRNL